MMTEEEKLMRLGDDLDPLEAAMLDVAAETERQDKLWGDQSMHPDGTGSQSYRDGADIYRTVANTHDKDGTLTWADILLEEVFEALAESDAEKLRNELVQVAAVAAQWVVAIDKRGAL